MFVFDLSLCIKVTFCLTFSLKILNKSINIQCYYNYLLQIKLIIISTQDIKKIENYNIQLHLLKNYTLYTNCDTL